MAHYCELCSLDDPRERAILVEAAGESLVGPFDIVETEIKVSDDTEEGRKRIAELIQQGFVVKSVES